MRRSSALTHSGPLALFAALGIAWTWPLAAHLSDAIPGLPGDNYSFVWNLWWMRHVMATPGLSFFRTTYLFHPFGSTIVDHPNTALPALVAATVLAPLSAAAAQNVLLLAFVFANMAAMYALAWDILRQRRAAVLAGVLFGTSPYLAAHLLGHFDLMAAWLLPLFALLIRRAVQGSNTAAVCAALTLTAAAYTAYYYVFYIGLFAIVYLAAGVIVVDVRWTRRLRTFALRQAQAAIGAAIGALTVLAAWIALTGGGSVSVLSRVVSMHAPQNPLTVIWILTIAWALCAWRPTLTLQPPPIPALRRTLVISAVLATVFLTGTAPLVVEAARLVAHGAYVTQIYFWRSAPRGIDLVAPLLGPPRHPLLGPVARGAYAAARLDVVEGVAWIGVVPMLLILVARRPPGDDARIWRSVGVVFAVIALGPILTVLGFDTGLWLPAVLFRYLPIAENARMSGRAIVVVYAAVAILAAMTLGRARGWLSRPAVQWALVALVAFEYFDAPVPLTPLDRPTAYQALAGQPPGAVCEVPFGIGDGLSRGVGSQDRRVLYYATVHEHPLAGGFIGRMPVDARDRYERMAIAADLLRLSDGRAAGGPPPETEPSPCVYLVVRTAGLSPALRAYVEELPREPIASDGVYQVFRLRDPIGLR